MSNVTTQKKQENQKGKPFYWQWERSLWPLVWGYIAFRICCLYYLEEKNAFNSIDYDAEYSYKHFIVESTIGLCKKRHTVLWGFFSWQVIQTLSSNHNIFALHLTNDSTEGLYIKLLNDRIKQSERKHFLAVFFFQLGYSAYWFKAHHQPVYSVLCIWTDCGQQDYCLSEQMSKTYHVSFFNALSLFSFLVHTQTHWDYTDKGIHTDYSFLT